MTEFVSGNIYIREGRLNSGGVVEGHAHSFDHTTYCPHGSLKIEALDSGGNTTKTAILVAEDGQNWALIKAECSHRLTALEDGTVYHCIYSHRSANPDNENIVIQKYDGYLKANI